MPRRIETLLLDGPAGKLEALLEEPEEGSPRQAVLVCHPHPQHGGTLHNKVVYRIARGLRRTRAVVLRFNYRGVNLSEGSYDRGIGEIEDARAALNVLRGRYPHLPYAIAGFSFGARIALKLGCELGDAEQLLIVGFPAKYGETIGVHGCEIPRAFIQSTNDEFGSVAETQAFFDALTGPKRLLFVEAGDHFFAGSLDAFEDAVMRVARGLA